MTVPAGYYAVPDPDQPDQQMTYWHVRTVPFGGPVTHWAPWPPRANYGPVLLRKDVPRDRAGRLAAILAHNADKTVWNTRIIDTVTHDPATAAARFAELRTRCFCCARSLRSDRWKVVGIGPDCFERAGLDYAALVATTTPAIAAAHALFLAQQAT